ncbi:MAG TPA: hypothetical protein DCE44_08890 [Verrucomicrobiales bacterium]|nr:hypothetical protein [Verrucomicrobiales bacterium]
MHVHAKQPFDDSQFEIGQFQISKGHSIGGPISQGIVDRSRDGFQSKTTAMSLLADRPPPDGSESLGQTKFWDHCAGALGEDRDGLGSAGISGALAEPPPLCPAAALGKAARNRSCLEKSRAGVKIGFLNLRKSLWVSLKFGFDLIDQSGQSRARAIVADDSLPRGVAVQFGHQRRQILRQLSAILRRQQADCRCDLLDVTHSLKLRRCRYARKPRAFPLTPSHHE